MMKCLICKKGIAVNDRCMHMRVEGTGYSIHMGCEHELTTIRTAVLMILADWGGLWYKYEKLMKVLNEKYSLTASKKEAREALQFLVKTGEVNYGPLVDCDYVPCGAGYTWKHGMGL